MRVIKFKSMRRPRCWGSIASYAVFSGGWMSEMQPKVAEVGIAIRSVCTYATQWWRYNAYCVVDNAVFPSGGHCHYRIRIFMLTNDAITRLSGTQSVPRHAREIANDGRRGPMHPAYRCQTTMPTAYGSNIWHKDRMPHWNCVRLASQLAVNDTRSG